MQVTDFQWTSPGVFAQPAKPIVHGPHIQKHPDAGAFAVTVRPAQTGW
jgi:hypothetical protein